MKLHYPVKPWDGGQAFGEKDPIYTKMGLLGHPGIDEPCPVGTPVYAAHDGVVTFTGYDDSKGLGVVLRGVDASGNYFKTIYWHLKEGGISVKPDQSVKAGDLLALSGNTGMSTGPHLHFGLKPLAKGENDWTWYNAAQSNGYNGAIDPKPYFTKKYAADIKPALEKTVSLLKELLMKLIYVRNTR